MGSFFFSVHKGRPACLGVGIIAVAQRRVELRRPELVVSRHCLAGTRQPTPAGAPKGPSCTGVRHVILLGAQDRPGQRVPAAASGMRSAFRTGAPVLRGSTGAPYTILMQPRETTHSTLVLPRASARAPVHCTGAARGIDFTRVLSRCTGTARRIDFTGVLSRHLYHTVP